MFANAHLARSSDHQLESAQGLFRSRNFIHFQMDDDVLRRNSLALQDSNALMIQIGTREHGTQQDSMVGSPETPHQNS
jgi:hypothetical protein